MLSYFESIKIPAFLNRILEGSGGKYMYYQTVTFKNAKYPKGKIYNVEVLYNHANFRFKYTDKLIGPLSSLK